MACTPFFRQAIGLTEQKVRELFAKSTYLKLHVQFSKQLRRQVEPVAETLAIASTGTEPTTVLHSVKTSTASSQDLSFARTLSGIERIFTINSFGSVPAGSEITAMQGYVNLYSTPHFRKHTQAVSYIMYAFFQSAPST